MKSTITYLVVFAIAFLFVTVGLYFMVGIYPGIFQFNFSAKPIEKSKSTVKKDSTFTKKRIDLIYGIDSLFQKYKTTTENASNQDSKKVDTVITTVVIKDTSAVDSLVRANQRILNLIAELNKKESELNKVQLSTRAQRDSVYKQWLKSTVKMYEAMDSKKAAKLISNYTDNEARDIIYSMKKKKAAEILSQLSSDTALKITRSQ